MSLGMHQECRFPRCPRYAEPGRGFCSVHIRERHHPTTNTGNLRPSNTRFRWMRDAFMRSHPFCAQCGDLATILDHVVPHRGIARLFWDQANWQSLCTKCHGIKTAAETLRN